ncbi:acyl-CoA synthetase [Mycobacterium intracellulare]|uniref:acyl-CoA synthetase n=2 Tax=Mycobacterium intracellulare TaxID=1767 RepID=UPI00044B459D|nr:long-chain fatty acid--CoA ligase [Mycobacterium intracellulare]ETZ36133.1 AMP-binding enzyme family protein [Mycobacterium intracellulare MIN_061107_1834]UEB22612.1 long-chain fatty acid--CoA ligase [Mycobacterium intracellulare]WVL05593.1 long-chain fatty acid--CoA ligase [Mycobacterium intracellulare]BCO46853.1 fatty-acid--CoA ligase [Mycobacterium intracellulare]BCO62674.1 fatty-acid--CoA ligase [Mycobacterium intracellulare]
MYLTQGLHRAVQETPDEVMTVCGTRQHTVREVAGRVARLAGALRTLGVGSEDRVAILALNSDRYHEYLFAVPWADAVLNPINIRWSAEEIAYCLRDSASRVLLIDDAFIPMLPGLYEAVPTLAEVIHIGDGPTPSGTNAYEDLIAGAEPIPDVRRGGHAIAGLFYTGGTTGRAKGVMLSHANLHVSWLGSTATGYGCQRGSRTLHAAPMFHLGDLAAWGATVLVAGSHVFLPAFSPLDTLSAIATHQVTDVMLVPAMIQMLIDHPEIGKHDLSSLRRVLYGAAPIPQALLERAMTAVPNASFIQAYGMTELSAVASLLSPADHDNGRLQSAGRAAPHSEIRVVDPLGTPMSPGAVGEIVVRGGHVMLGYWNKPDETDAAVRDGWMHTGDAGYIDEQGYLYVVDRLKDMIITGGENVYSAEVENAVARHPAVAQCAVIGVPDPDWGERVHAVVVLHAETTLALDELRAHTKTHIAGYKAPRSMEIVETLPLSGAGKVIKSKLREHYWSTVDRHVN